MQPTTIPLGDLAVARSGDKGGHANIGVVARSPQAYAHLVAWLTEERVADFFGDWGVQRVVRYELPNIHALNFVLTDALAGGAGESLRIDTQGKLLGTALQSIRLPAMNHETS